MRSQKLDIAKIGNWGSHVRGCGRGAKISHEYDMGALIPA